MEVRVFGGWKCVAVMCNHGCGLSFPSGSSASSRRSLRSRARSSANGQKHMFSLYVAFFKSGVDFALLSEVDIPDPDATRSV